MRNGYIESLAPQGSDVWLQARKGIITASDTPFTQKGELKSIWKSYCQNKFAEIIANTTANTKLLEEITQTDSKREYKSALMERGNKREVLTVKKYQLSFLKAGDIILQRGLIFNPIELLGASIDREVKTLAEKYLIEIKNPKFSTYIGYALDPQSLYRKYYIQAQIQLYVTNLKKCVVVADYPEMKLVTATITADKNFQQNLKKSLKKYKDYTLQLFKVYKQYKNF